MLEALLLVGVVGWIDHVTVWDLNCFPLYAIPIILIAWRAGRPIGCIFALLCSAVDWAADAEVNPYKTTWGFGLSVTYEFLNFCILVTALTALKERQELDRKKILALQRLQTLERNILRVTEQEQLRIGRDLHDDLGPQLAAIRYATSFMAKELRQRGQPEAVKAEQISRLLADTGSLVHDLARGIFPVQMQQLGLAAALKNYAETISTLTGIPVSFSESGDVRIEPPKFGMQLHRIAQEAVNNAVRHSEARQIDIVLSEIPGGLRLSVIDDGKGMAGPLNGHSGMGLDSMKYRAHAMGGCLKIETDPGTGTAVTCEIPRPPSEVANLSHD
jgi:signal transduction histidine kinase